MNGPGICRLRAAGIPAGTGLQRPPSVNEPSREVELVDEERPPIERGGRGWMRDHDVERPADLVLDCSRLPGAVSEAGHEEQGGHEHGVPRSHLLPPYASCGAAVVRRWAERDGVRATTPTIGTPTNIA